VRISEAPPADGADGADVGAGSMWVGDRVGEDIGGRGNDAVGDPVGRAVDKGGGEDFGVRTSRSVVGD
jgi:hypothetical protein